MIHIPLLDIKKQYLRIKPEIDEAIQDVVASASFIKGKYVKLFEDEFADYIGANHCIGVGNGTDALQLALMALDIGPGDEVITVPNSFFATAEAIVRVGATPVFADINYENYSLDPNSLPKLITPQTRAIIPVHLYGIPCNIEKITAIANQNNLYVIYDGAQAHGAMYKDLPLGACTPITTFSFYPGKNLGAYGDGGAVVCNDDQLALKIRMLADHGRVDKYRHEMFGLNSRLDTIQAAVLLVKLKYLDEWNNRRRSIAKLYMSYLNRMEEITVPKAAEDTSPCWHQYVVRVKERDNLKAYLLEKGIETGIHYPVPLPFQSPLRNLKSSFDADQLALMADTILSLPICPEMTDDMVLTVIKAIYGFYGEDFVQ